MVSHTTRLACYAIYLSILACSPSARPHPQHQEEANREAPGARAPTGRRRHKVSARATLQPSEHPSFRIVGVAVLSVALLLAAHDRAGMWRLHLAISAARSDVTRVRTRHVDTSTSTPVLARRHQYVTSTEPVLVTVAHTVAAQRWVLERVLLKVVRRGRVC